MSFYDFIHFSEGQAELFGCIRAISNLQQDKVQLEIRHIAELPSHELLVADSMCSTGVEGL